MGELSMGELSVVELAQPNGLLLPAGGDLPVTPPVRLPMGRRGFTSLLAAEYSLQAATFRALDRKTGDNIPVKHLGERSSFSESK